MTGRKQKIFIIKKQDTTENDRKLHALRLRHPRTGQATGFFQDADSNDILEVQIYDDSPRSWLVGSSVEADGQIYVCTPFDPLFLVLSYIRQSKYAEQLDQLLVDCEFPDAARVARAVDPSRMELVAQRKGDPDLQAFQYSEERTLAWLEHKVRRLATVLETKRLHGTSGKAANFVKVTQHEVAKEVYLKFAWGITSEYLSGELSAALRKHLGLPEEKAKRPDPTAEPPSKRARSESVAPLEDYGALVKQSKQTLAPQNAKQKALAKSAVGSKSIMSFFKKNSVHPTMIVLVYSSPAHFAAKVPSTIHVICEYIVSVAGNVADLGSY